MYIPIAKAASARHKKRRITAKEKRKKQLEWQQRHKTTAFERLIAEMEKRAPRRHIINYNYIQLIMSKNNREGMKETAILYQAIRSFNESKKGKAIYIPEKKEIRFKKT